MSNYQYIFTNLKIYHLKLLNDIKTLTSSKMLYFSKFFEDLTIIFEITERHIEFFQI